MWNNKYYILLVALLIFSSCKKNEVIYDKEKELPKDTLTFISDYSYSISAFTPNEANVSISFVTFNQLSSKTNYSSDVLLLDTSSASYAYSAQSDIVTSAVKLNNFSTIFLLEKGSDSWYIDEHNFGFYFRRFLEQTKNNVAIGYYETTSPNSQVQIFNTDGGSIFNNDPKENMTEVFNVISEFNGYNYSIANVIDKIDQTITIYANSYSSMPNKSITTILPSSYTVMSSDSLLITNLINRAISEGIALNFISQINSFDFQEMASLTGGFTVNNVFTDYNLGYKTPSYVGVTLENLESILLKDYTYHQYNFKVTNPSGPIVNSGYPTVIGATYNGVKFNYMLKN